MRTEESWKQGIIHKIYPCLTPRIVKDLKTINFTEDVEMQENESYFISGDTSTGKTLLSVRMLLSFLKSRYLNGQNCLNAFQFISCNDLIENIAESFSDPMLKGKILKKYINCDLLIIDDLGTFPVYPWVYQVLYTLINSRYENMKSTIITSNEDLNDLSLAFGDIRITKRIERSYKIIEKSKF